MVGCFQPIFFFADHTESCLQRCVQHKGVNLLEHCPAHARRELKRDYNRIVCAKDGMEARKAYDEFLRRLTWRENFSIVCAASAGLCVFRERL